MIRIVQNDDIAGEELFEFVHRGGNRCRHTAQMHRDMRRLRDHARPSIEYGAAEIEPLTDIRAEAGAPQGDAHFFGNGSK